MIIIIIVIIINNNNNNNNKYLITESEVVTGKSQTEALSYSEVSTVGRGLRSVEVIKLFIIVIWLMN